MLVWIIGAAAVVLVCLLLSMKVGVRVLFGAELQAWARIGPITLRIYPVLEGNKKRPPKEKKGDPQQTQPQEKSAGRQITFDAVWQLITALLDPALDAMDRVRRGLHVRCLRLCIVVSDPNPAVAARRYGTLNSVLWPLIAVTENLVTVERREVCMDLDFSARQSRAEGEVEVTLRLYHGLCILLADGMQLLRPVLQFMKTIKPAKDTKKDSERKQQNKAAAA